MFDRDKEVSDLLKYFNNCISKGVNCGVLVYGWRRVGKTTILKAFIERVHGIYIDCIWISDPVVFVKTLMNHELFKNSDFEKEFKLILLEEDPFVMLKRAFDLLIELGSRVGKLAVVLDEFHIFVDKMATRIAREKRQSKQIVEDDILGLIKHVVETKSLFWVFSTSIGWRKLREKIIKSKKIGSPLIGVLTKYKIAPFDKNTSIEFARKINPNLDTKTAEEIYQLTGGIPKLIEAIAINVLEDSGVIGTALDLLEKGEFDDFFENIIKFIAEVSKRDYTVLIQTLKCVEMKEKTTEDIAKCLGIDLDSAYVLAEELVKMEILEKRKLGRRGIYSIKYPLLSQWLSLKVQPEKSAYELLASKFGIAIESYVRELIREYINKKKPIEIWDNKEGTFLLGTTDKLAFKPIRILKPSQLAEELSTSIDVDIAVECEGELALIEIKATGIKVTKENIIELWKRIQGIKRKVLTLLIIIEPEGITLPAITEAIRRNIIILTGEGLRILAKKVNFPHW